MNINDKFTVPTGATLWFVNLQQSFITTTEYVINITQISEVKSTENYVYGDLYQVINKHCIPRLMKIFCGRVSVDKRLLKPI